MKIKISIIIPVYNEEKRIKSCLDSIPDAFDEIIVFDKGSTDNTLSVIKKYSNVSIISIPFSNRGEENYNEIFKYPKNDWVFAITASEILPKNIFYEISRELTNETSPHLIMVPRKMYVFQSYVKNSPWSIAYYPFCFDKTKVLTNNNVHSLFSVKNDKKIAYLPINNQSTISHFTHNSFDNYFKHIDSYIQNEFEKYRDVPDAVKKCKDQIAIYQNLFKSKSTNETIQYAAWSIYWNSIIIKLLESKHNLEYKNMEYQNYINAVLKKPDTKSHYYRPSNFFIIFFKRFYRKYYSLSFVRKLRLIIKKLKF